MMDGEEAGCSFKRVFTAEPYEKVTAEQKPDGDKGVCHADVRGEWGALQAEGTAHAKALG